MKSQGAAAIVALTHQDFDQDQWLAREYPEVNLIVGGHEHFFIEKQIGNTWITKADADNKSAIVHDVYLAGGKVSSSHRKVDLDQTIAKDPQVAAEVERQLQRLAGLFDKQGKDLKQVLGYTEHLLEGVEPAVRGRETALGNFLADTMRERMQTDIAFTNGGGIRINDNIPPGPVTLYDMEGLFYYDNKLVSFALTGQQLLDVLNNSVSKTHLGDGRFLQVSGIRFGYHAEPQADGGVKYRVEAGDVRIKPRGAKQDQALDLRKTYSVASTDFIWEHGSSDGYEIFGKGEGKTSPRRLDDGTAIGFRQTVETALAKLPQRTIPNASKAHRPAGTLIRRSAASKTSPLTAHLGETMAQPRYYFADDERFVVEQYNDCTAFASFLPGIAGVSGRPAWAFYVNRGQAVASFGVRNKDGAFLEFFPADKAYQLTPARGFRTFLKISGGAAFVVTSRSNAAPRRMWCNG
ncbi:bifunctional metallophosphatase/5'-nucleotidase [Methylomonas koyamae]|uniref:bifunctional metallophosphatase/5'-nucleotidase n=1 Tax=Methylomonas koyamae TaxID=702114 RepID=UPI0006D00A00|nr:5'-nucleotidase C-terminal domain-containing protein [Methylomonas koyamae]